MPPPAPRGRDGRAPSLTAKPLSRLAAMRHGRIAPGRRMRRFARAPARCLTVDPQIEGSPGRISPPVPASLTPRTMQGRWPALAAPTVQTMQVACLSSWPGMKQAIANSAVHWPPVARLPWFLDRSPQRPCSPCDMLHGQMRPSPRQCSALDPRRGKRSSQIAVAVPAAVKKRCVARVHSAGRSVEWNHDASNRYNRPQTQSRASSRLFRKGWRGPGVSFMAAGRGRGRSRADRDLFVTVASPEAEPAQAFINKSIFRWTKSIYEARWIIAPVIVLWIFVSPMGIIFS